jgi:hypothetical protein
MALTIQPYIAPKLGQNTALSLLPLCAFMAGYRINFNIFIRYRPDAKYFNSATVTMTAYLSVPSFIPYKLLVLGDVEVTGVSLL